MNINAIRNVQGQFGLPRNLITIYNKFSRKYGDESGKLLRDSSRRVAYELIEYFWERWLGSNPKIWRWIIELFYRDGKNGQECLQRTICEAAESPINHNGLLGEILQLLFTPNEGENVDQDYMDAKKAGEHGVDCLKLFPDCPLGDGILDDITLYQEFTDSP